MTTERPTKDWKKIDLCGAVSIDRVCALFEVEDGRVVPGRRFRIKVLERQVGDYLAVPNMFVRLPDGTPNYISGLASTEYDAVQDLLRRLMEQVQALPDDAPEERFEWADPRDF